MTFAPVSMPMPSVDCPTPFSQTPKAFVLDRLKQRFTKYERHDQECNERFNLAQQTIRLAENEDTKRLLQRANDNLKNKKGVKSRLDSRPKVPTVDPSDNENGYQGLPLSRIGPSLKRKMPMGGEQARENHGFGDNAGPQQEPKKMKNDQPNMNNNQRQEYLPSVSVQIVQNFAGEPTSQIETTVNVHSNRNMPDSQSVRVNVDSKNIKQETDGRRGQQSQHQQPQMNQQNMNQCPGGANNADADLGGLLEDDFIPGTEDIDFNVLNEIIDQMPEVFDRDLMTPDTQRHPTPQTQQQMPSQSPQMPPQSQHHHNMMSQQHHPMTSQNAQMMSPPHNHHIASQSPQMTSQNHHPMTTQSPRMAPQSHQQHMPSQSPRTGAQQMHHHSMTSQSPQMASQYPQQQHHHHMTSHPQHMTSPLRHMASPPVQHMSSPPTMMQQNARMVCKREKVDMYHGFRGNTPENKPQDPQVHARQNPHGMTQQNISANVVNRQSVQITGGGNFSANLSSQQNISLNVMQQNNYNPNPRMMPTNNNSNMTSQHIHRLNQVAQFAPRDPTPPEQSRMYHAQANTHAPAQPNYYESHSQHLKQLAEKRSYGMNPSSGPMNVPMTHDPRSAQHYPPHYRTDAAPPAMAPQMNVPNHPHHHHPHHHHHHPNMAPSGSQRMPMSENAYSRSSSQFVQAQRPGMNVMMQQSESMVMKQYQMQPNQHHSYYNRVPEPHPQQVMPNNPNQGYVPGSGPHPSWNPRGGPWPSHNTMHRTHMPQDQRTHMPQDHRPQVTPDLMRPQMNPDLAQSNYLPELDNELNIIDEILSKN